MKKNERGRKAPASPEAAGEEEGGWAGSEVSVDDGAGEDGVDESEEVLKTLNGLVDELVGVLDMRDWHISVEYSPDSETGTIADVSYSIHREATVTVYDYRPDRVREDLLHELLHCKVGIARTGYEVVFEHQRRMIDELAQGYEEMFIDDLVRMVGSYAFPAKKRDVVLKQLELFPDGNKKD
ncbi:hypothetical protein JW898_00285 [Candidatus Woesearchaeota archaeon]|nr:hypothetical protein [Candidatus Woesearchaeota archaeon]